MSDNYYQFLSDMNTPQGIAQDEEAVRKHPDGSECHAKSAETCPILNQAKKADETDDLGNGGAASQGSATPAAAEPSHPEDKRDRHLAELKSILEDPKVQQAIPAIKGMTFNGLAAAYDAVGKEYEELEKNLGTDYMRGTRAAADKVAADHPGQNFHTFTMDGRDRNEELEQMDVWGVTFHTTRMNKPDDPGYVNDEDYDRRVAMLDKVSGSDGPNVGIFQGKPEISVACPSMEKALAQMVRFEQNSIYNYKTGKTIYNLTYSEDENPGLERGTEHVG